MPLVRAAHHGTITVTNRNQEVWMQGSSSLPLCEQDRKHLPDKLIMNTFRNVKDLSSVKIACSNNKRPIHNFFLSNKGVLSI